MKLFLNTTFCEFYSWNVKYYSVGYSKRRAIYLLGLLIFFNLFSIYIFIASFANRSIPRLFSNAGATFYLMALVFIYLFLFIYFKTVRHVGWCNKYSTVRLFGLSRKRVAQLYILSTLIAFFISGYLIYLKTH